MWAVLNHPNGKAYFFGNGIYQRYNYTTASVERTARTGTDGWVGVWGPTQESAINHPDGKAYFFSTGFNKRNYQRFDFSINNGLGGAVDKEATVNVDGWMGLGVSMPTFPIMASILHPNGKAYFFFQHGYQQFNFGINNGKGGAVDMEGRIGFDGWVGLKTVGDFYVPGTTLRAAIMHPDGHAYFFYDGDSYQRFNFGINNGKGGAVDMDGKISNSMWHEVTV